MHFNHYGGPGAQLAAALVNLSAQGTAGPAEVHAAIAACEVGVGPFDAASAAALLGWGARLAGAFSGPQASRVDAVNELLAEAAARPFISTHDGKPPHLHYASVDGTPLTRARAFTAAGVAHLLCEEPGRLGRCAAPGCAVAYVDTSRNGRRRFCDLRCANRQRVAEHRERATTAAARRP